LEDALQVERLELDLDLLIKHTYFRVGGAHVGLGQLVDGDGQHALVVEERDLGDHLQLLQLLPLVVGDLLT